MKKLFILLALVLCLTPATSQACQQYRNVLQDLNGNILPFGQITVYKANTNVAATLYADSLCTVSMVNPTTSVQDGTFTFFTVDGYYDLIFSYPNHTFSNVFSLPLFEPVLENMIPVSKYDTDICAPSTGAIAQIGGSSVWLWVNKPVTCGTTTSAPNTLNFFIAGGGSITETGGAVLTINGGVIKKPHYQVLTSQLPSVTPDMLLGSVFEISPPNNTAFTINPPIHGYDGAILQITIYNVSGAPLGAVTWDTTNTGYKMRAWTQPANNFQRSITFMYLPGLRWTEIARTEADIPY